MGEPGRQQQIAHPPPQTQPLSYEPARRGESGRPWARAFLFSGGYALACVPAVFLFERMRWWEAPLHITSFGACVICAVSAVRYLWASRKDSDGGGGGGVAPRHTRTLAYVAVALAGGFLLLCVLVELLLALTPPFD